MTQELATTEDNAVMALEGFDAFGSQGTEEIGSSDVVMPFLKLIQSTSDEVKTSKSAYNPDAKPGMFLNTVTQELSEAVTIVPVLFQNRYTEWKPISEGGGFVNDFGTNPEPYEAVIPDDKGVRKTDAGTEMVCTPTLYALTVNTKTGEFTEVIIPFGGTNGKGIRQINSKMKAMRAKNPATGNMEQLKAWFNVFELTPAVKSNEKGEWFVASPSHLCLTPQLENAQGIVAAAENFYNIIQSGAVQVVAPQEHEAESTESAAPTHEGDDEIPF